jgi:competence protein ComGC
MKHGYLLMEALIAMLLISIGLGPLLASLGSANKSIQDQKKQAQLLVLAEAKMEELKFRWKNKGFAADQSDWVSSLSWLATPGASIASYGMVSPHVRDFLASHSVTASVVNGMPLYRIDLVVVQAQDWMLDSRITTIPPKPFSDPILPELSSPSFSFVPGSTIDSFTRTISGDWVNQCHLTVFLKTPTL